MSDSAHAIRSLRLERAWSQEDLAAAAGLSARTVQRLEQGQKPSLETLKALAAAFNVPVARLAPGQAPTASPETAAMCPDPIEARQKFRRQLLAYVLVIGGLAAFNLLRHPGHLWVIYPALGWGIPLAVKGFRLGRRDAAG